ncbi:MULTISPECIES: FAD-dependent oxidoreductase [unclassified Polynucleobacter]|jgi:predicted NAD/FAD-dependent oxidoreductase|uniref:NAD(P)/FAD-dependent oxidoreductase n=1 Tax=unclassified Polynucleobacter TaxID=2640945 RepID=UPI000BC7638E|nr:MULTISPECIES: FAD-dependent oxidoreductase [unclassified Polynucleobacter]OYY21543.1 MAG: TetR family transcriptional regulator [Polynucleobacter sp. 35-46-11]OZA78373.1 MAG: TetR family transcriptional regulator [Polynucleobacter sp. 39-46-10]
MNSNKEIERVAIIGAGIAGLSCARELKLQGISADIFEKSRGPSGRMSTRRSEGWSADHGAQYFTARDPRFIQEVQQWMRAGTAAIWTPKIKVYEAKAWRESNSQEIRYIGTPNMNSPGKHLAEELSIQYETTISQLDRRSDKWHLRSNEIGDIPTSYDFVVLAIPAPQASALVRSLDIRASDIADSAQMKACWTMMANFPNQKTADFDAAFINQEIIGWICQNGSKPMRQGNTWTIHGSPAWSQENVELSKEDAQDQMVQCLTRLGLNCRDAEISMHRWRYASGGLENSISFLSLPDIGLGLCSDWLNGGRVEGAWLSGLELALMLKEI